MKAIGLGLEGYEVEVPKGSVITHLKAEFNNKFESRKTSCAGKCDKFMTLLEKRFLGLYHKEEET